MYLSGEYDTQTAITQEVGCSESTTSQTIDAYEDGILPHPDKEEELESAPPLNQEEHRFIAQQMIDQGDMGLRIARKIINNLPDENDARGGGRPNL